MYKENLEKYNKAYEKIINTTDDKKGLFELSIDFLNLKDEDGRSNFYSTERICTDIIRCIWSRFNIKRKA